MIRLEQSGFSSLGRQVPLAGAAVRLPHAPKTHQPTLAQVPASPRVVEAKAMLDMAIENLRSAEDNLSFLEISLGPEAALQALEEGQTSVELRREDYERAIAEGS